jgi:hypothetical protein
MPTTRPGAAARRLASRQASSAPDVDYLVTGPDAVGGAKMLMVSAQLGVVEIQAARRGHRRDATGLKQRADDHAFEPGDSSRGPRRHWAPLTTVAWAPDTSIGLRCPRRLTDQP